MTNLERKSIFEVHELLSKGKLSVLELTTYFSQKINQCEQNIKAFVSLNKNFKADAARIDDLFKTGQAKGVLSGIPAGIKDNILVKGKKTTASSRMLENYQASYDATVVEKLKKSNAIFMGKTNLDEFAMGSSTENSAFFTTKNPYNLKLVPGGSSGGSAAAVASGECLYGLGSDTGGSVRQPAAFCGVVGLKPTYGSVSRYGLIALASSLDVIGPITKSVDEAAAVFEVIKGKDEKDATSRENYSGLSEQEHNKKTARKWKIGLPKEYFSDAIDSAIRQKIDKVIGRLDPRIFLVEKTSLPHTKYALATYYIILPSEASANLARYDSLRYGTRLNQESLNLVDFYLNERTSKLGNEVRRRIILGVYSLSSGYYDAYYLKAQQVRTVIAQEFQEAFQDYDLLVTPTTPTTAFAAGEKLSPLEMYFSDICTVPASLAGLPAISVPCGRINGLPVGLQIIAKPFREKDLFYLGAIIEKITDKGQI